MGKRKVVAPPKLTKAEQARKARQAELLIEFAEMERKYEEEHGHKLGESVLKKYSADDYEDNEPEYEDE
ncbi:MAG: hypothetical protein LBN30_00235 [Oscillospiraceae bacterium]|jgi:hypothetical protein|nr:hypothetical protein [Oscillospiraceae bacterium]